MPRILENVFLSLDGAIVVRLMLGALVVLLVVLQYEFWFSDGGMRTVWHLQKDISAQQKVNDQLEMRNQKLITAIRDLQNGNVSVEAHARNDLGMVKPGEVFYRIIPQQQKNK